MSTTIQHHDMLGKPVKVGDWVAYPQYNIIYIGQITKLTAKRVFISKANTKGHTWGSQQMSGTFILMDPVEVSMWSLKGGKTKADIIYENAY